MNQDPASSPAPTPTPPQRPTPSSYTQRPLTTKKPATKKAPWIIAGIVVLALIAGGIYYFITTTSNKNQTAGDSSQSQTDDSKEVAMITTTLPSGQTATYADTEANKNITFSESSKGDGYVDLSYAKIDEYLAAADATSLVSLCGADGEKAQIDNIVVATINTSVRAIEYPNENNCLDEFVTMRNPDSASRTSAMALVKEVEDTVREFYRTVTIK